MSTRLADLSVCASGIGCRVVRGPDWKWRNQDGGEGHVGSLRRFEARGEAVVLWDSGIVANYRCGTLGFDLRVLDSSPTGEKHADSICEGCNESPIYGIRWKCMLCLNVDLCSSCYHGDKHCLNHRFLRITAPCKTRVAVGRRMKARKIDAVGLFPKARVVRGFDWRWGTQDCAEGVVNSLLLSGNTSRDPTSSSSSAMSVPCQGRIIDRRDWYQWAPRSAVSVAWDSGAYNVYRVGYMGMVDLKAVRPTKGGSYYVDHLPLLADLRDINAVESFQPAGVPRALENLTSTAASAAAAAPTWLNLETGRRASWHRRPAQIRESMPSTASESTDFETGVLAFASPSSSFDAVDSGDRMPLTEAVLNENVTTESVGAMTSSQRPSSTPSQQPLQEYAQPPEASTHSRPRGGRTANETSDPARSRVQNSRTLLADLFCAGGGASGPGSVSDPSSPPRSRVAPETSGNRTLRTPIMLNRAPVVTGAATAVCRQTVAPVAQSSSNDGRPVAGASLVGATLRLRPGAVIQLRLRSMSNEASPSGSEYLSLPSVVERVDDTSGSVVLMVPQTGQRFTLTSSHQQCASAATGPCLPPASSAQLTVPVQSHSTGRHGEDQTRQQVSARQAASSVLTRMRRRDSYSRGNLSGTQPPSQPPQAMPTATAGSSSEAAGHAAREQSAPEGQSSLPARPDHETYAATGDRDSMPSASTSRGTCLRQSGKHVSEELMFAAAEGNVKKITWLIKHSEVDVNTHYAGGTALHIACQSGHLNCVDVLLRHGADCKQRDADGNQALHSAAQGGCLNVLRRIAMHCLEQVPCPSNMAPNYPTGQRPPSGQTTENVTVSDPAATASGAAATGAGDPSVSDPGPLVQSASEQPLDVNSRNALRQTPLHLAAVGRHLDCARCLLEEFNALPSLQDCDGDTPLHDAISGQNMAMVELLLSDRADLTITNSLGHNCLHHGALVGDAGVFSALLAQCFHMPWLLDEPRPDGFTPLHLAVLYGHLDVVDALLVAGANVNAESAILLTGASVALGSRLTPLHLAVQKAHTTITCLLLAHGANACARDAADKRPIDLILPLLSSTARPPTTEAGLTSSLSNSNASPPQTGSCADTSGAAANHSDSGIELSMIPFLASVARFLITSENSASPNRPVSGSHLDGASPLRKRIESIVQTTLNSGTPATVLIAACLAAAMGLERQSRADFEHQRQQQQQEIQPPQSPTSLLIGSETASGSEDPFHTRVFSSLGNPVIELALQQCYLEACLSNGTATGATHQSSPDTSVYPQFVSRSPDVETASSATALNDFFASATTTDNRACDRIVGDNLLQSGTGSPTGSSMSIANFLMPSDWSGDVGSAVASTSNSAALAPTMDKSGQPNRVASVLPLNMKDVAEELRECLVCSNADRAALLIPCGHVVACQTCTQLLKKCITCRQPITGYREIPACRECTFRPAVTFTRECNHFLVCRECIVPRLTRLTRAMVAGDGVASLAKPEWQASGALLVETLGFLEEDEGGDQGGETAKRQQLLLAMFNAGELCPDGACPECGQGVSAIWSLEMACCQSDLRSTLSTAMPTVTSRRGSVEVAVGGVPSADLAETLLVPITVTQNSAVWLTRENNQVLHASAISSPHCVSPQSRQSSIRNTTSRPPLPRCTQAGGSNARPNNMHPSVATGITGRSTPSLSRSAEEQATNRELKRLQHELQAMREQTRCPICLDRSRNLVFMCGHATCQWCGDQVAVCPICRRAVTGRIVLY